MSHFGETDNTKNDFLIFRRKKIEKQLFNAVIGVFSLSWFCSWGANLVLKSRIDGVS